MQRREIHDTAPPVHSYIAVRHDPAVVGRGGSRRIGSKEEVVKDYNFVATVQAEALPHPKLSNLLTFLFLIDFAHLRNGWCRSGLRLRL